MNFPRVITCLAVIGLGMSTVYLIPVRSEIQPSDVRLNLPDTIGIWTGTDEQISEKELIILAQDTEFARKTYTNAFGDHVMVSIVLSGQDLDNSIHRPERCLPAQGWVIADSRPVSIDLGPNQPRLPTTRLHNFRRISLDDGRIISVYNLDYYWFIGHGHLSASHIDRTYTDIRDRVMHGFNQRWAYVTVAATVTKDLQRFGRTEAETDAMIQEMIQKLFPLIYVPSHDPAAPSS